MGRPKDDGTKPPEDDSPTSVSTHLESGFGFVPAGIEFDKPQPEWFKPREKWRARMKVNGIEVHVGYFDNEHDAAEAWNKEALRQYGPDSFQNTINRKEVGQK